MTTAAPEIIGYQFGEQLLDHRLAQIWRGRSTIGMDVVLLQLTEAGAADPAVRERLEQASRTAALEQTQGDAPLWAGNFNTTLPYAITQVLPGQAGVERFLDPLDGILGNDAEAVEQVRRQLVAGFSPSGPPYAAGLAGVPEDKPKREPKQGWFDRFAGFIGWRIYPLVIMVVLTAFTVSYSVGVMIRALASDASPGSEANPPAAAKPQPLPTGVVLPGIRKAVGAQYQQKTQPVIVTGVSYTGTENTELIDDFGLPFAFRWPAPAGKISIGESSYAIYRRVVSGESPATSKLDAEIAVHPCTGLAGCLKDRAEFDRRWTKRFRTTAPATAKDGQTWFRVQDKPYAVAMTRAFQADGRWWLVGVQVNATAAGWESAAQKVLNDIRTQID